MRLRRPTGAHRLRTGLHIFPLVTLGLVPIGYLLLPRLALAQSSVDKLQEFPLSQVQVTDAYQKNLFTKDVTYLITTLDSDRLLAGFKAVTQGTTATNLYGGWESQNIRGHSMGHWLSAVARAYEQARGSDATLAAQLKTKLDDVVSKLKSYQLSSGFLFATPISQFDDFDAGTGSTWVPYYTMHKILAGLIDAYEFENNADALAVASKLGDWLDTRAAGWSASAKSRVLSQEYGGMNDALYELYKHTKSAKHLTVAHVFDDTSLFATLAAGTDNLNGKHANMTIPKFIGALNRYRTVGASESSYLNAASGFFDVVLKSHTYVTGGNSEDEHFHVAGQLDKMRDDVNNETCNAYNMSKLARDLFRVTSDVKYADFYERIHINEILSSIHPETGMTTYFKPMGTGYFKAFGTTTNSFWCCTGTGMENFTRLGDSVYFHNGTDLWVSFYVSSTLNWEDRGLSLTQATDLPLSNKVTFTIRAAPLDAVSIRFRKPYWLSSCQPMTVSVNSQSFHAVESNGFLGVSRVWQVGDQVELTIPAEVQVSRLPDNQNAVAFTYGPLVLSAGLGTASMTTTGHAWTIAATKPNGLQEAITINNSTTINSWIANVKDNLVQTAGKLEFSLKNTDSDGKLVFVPHYSRYQDRYGIYWKLAGTAGGTVPVTTCSGTGGTTSVAGAGGATANAGGSTSSGGATASAGGRTSGGGAPAVTATGGGASTLAVLGGAAGTFAGRRSEGGTAPVTSQVATGGTAAGFGGNNDAAGGVVQSSGAKAGVGGTTVGGTQGFGGAITGGNGNANGSATVGGAAVTANGDANQTGGCSCRLGPTSSPRFGALGLLVGLGVLLRSRRRQS